MIICISVPPITLKNLSNQKFKKRYYRIKFAKKTGGSNGGGGAFH